MKFAGRTYDQQTPRLIVGSSIRELEDFTADVNAIVYERMGKHKQHYMKSVFISTFSKAEKNFDHFNRVRRLLRIEVILERTIIDVYSAKLP